MFSKKESGVFGAKMVGWSPEQNKAWSVITFHCEYPPPLILAVSEFAWYFIKLIVTIWNTYCNTF